MTDEICLEMARTRMLEWAHMMATRHATPVLALAMGQDDHAGKTHLLVGPEFNRADIVEMLMLLVVKVQAGTEMKQEQP